jgi:hypothetical protein
MVDGMGSGQPAALPIASDSAAGHHRFRFVPPEIKRLGDAPAPIAFVGRPPPFDFGWIERAGRRRGVINQAEPVQLGNHLVARAAGMTADNRPTVAVAQRQCGTAAIVYRTAAAPPYTGALHGPERAGDFGRSHGYRRAAVSLSPATASRARHLPRAERPASPLSDVDDR